LVIEQRRPRHCRDGESACWAHKGKPQTKSTAAATVPDFSSTVRKEIRVIVRDMLTSFFGHWLLRLFQSGVAVLPVGRILLEQRSLEWSAGGVTRKYLSLRLDDQTQCIPVHSSRAAEVVKDLVKSPKCAIFIENRHVINLRRSFPNLPFSSFFLRVVLGDRLSGLPYLSLRKPVT
jgi:hypothetical protein